MAKLARPQGPGTHCQQVAWEGSPHSLRADVASLRRVSWIKGAMSKLDIMVTRQSGQQPCHGCTSRLWGAMQEF